MSFASGENFFSFVRVTLEKTIETELPKPTHHFQARTPPNPHHHLDTLLRLPTGHLHSGETETEHQDTFYSQKEHMQILKESLFGDRCT